MLPRALWEYTDGKDFVDLTAATLAEAVAALNARFPGLAYRLLDDQGNLRKYVLAFVNDEAVSQGDPKSVDLKDGDTVYLVPSVAGG